jgi:hypothetical protein
MKYRMIFVSKQTHGPNADYLVITEDGQVAHRRPDEAGEGRQAIVDHFGTRVTDEGVDTLNPWPMLDAGQQWCQDYEKDTQVEAEMQEYDILLDILSFLQPTIPFGQWVRDDSIFPDLFSKSRFPTILLYLKKLLTNP